jgi:hypothetical protein
VEASKINPQAWVEASKIKPNQAKAQVQLKRLVMTLVCSGRLVQPLQDLWMAPCHSRIKHLLFNRHKGLRQQIVPVVRALMESVGYPHRHYQVSPAPAAAPTSPEALRTAVDLQNYFSDLQRIALGESDAQQALARFGIAPEQSYFQYRESFPEFGDLSGTPGGLAGIIRSLGSMPRTAESFAEGGRVGESMERRDIQTDVGKFGQMLRDLMLMTDEPTGRQAERLAMAEEAGYVSPAIAQREGALYQPGGLMPRVDRTIEVSPLPPPGMTREMTQRKRQNNSGLMPRDLSIDVSQMPMSGMLQDKAQREKLLSENRNQNITEAVSPGMSRERTQRERELSRPRNQRDLESLIEALRKEPASSLVDFNEAEDLEEQDPDAYNALTKETRKHKCLILFHV